MVYFCNYSLKDFRARYAKLSQHTDIHILNEIITNPVLFDTTIGSNRTFKDGNTGASGDSFYHGILLGLLKAEGSWIVKSNAESGIGYTDIKLVIPSEKTGCIIEVKYAEKGTFEAACHEAMNQIEDGGYVTVLRQEGMHTIHKFGIACYKKNCRVAYDKEEKI